VTKKIFISAGEASGDLHAAGLIAELRKLHPDISLWGLGGDRMRSEGVETHYDISDLSTMGLAEVVRKLPFFRRVLKTVKGRLDENRPDAAILVDYPGMNFKFADRLNRLGIPLIYYILPQVWAWHRSRTEKMKRWNSKFISILPFEPEFFSKHGLEIEFCGHPLVDLAKPETEPDVFRASAGLGNIDKLIAVLPGSRIQEIGAILPVVLSATKVVGEQFGNLKVMCRPADRSQNDMFTRIIRDAGADAEMFNGNMYDLLAAADLTLVASGTSTVEAAICRSPSIVLYRTNWLTYIIAKRVINVSNIAMANIIAGESIYPELIQSDVNPERIVTEIMRFLNNSEYTETVRSKAARVLTLLGEGDAYKRAGRTVAAYLFGCGQ
jgi:lipid-A-disaccharide synthase